MRKHILEIIVYEGEGLSKENNIELFNELVEDIAQCVMVHKVKRIDNINMLREVIYKKVGYVLKNTEFDVDTDNLPKEQLRKIINETVNDILDDDYIWQEFNGRICQFLDKNLSKGDVE
ncbi:MAG: hypothetical protein ACOCRO_07865 [Halanaerobiales bacterium]